MTRAGAIEAAGEPRRPSAGSRRYVAVAPDQTSFVRWTTRAVTHAVVAPRAGGTGWLLVGLATSKRRALLRVVSWNGLVPDRPATVVLAREVGS